MRRILVACEFSGRVRDAFAKKGWEAWSCDLLPTETQGNHIQGDVVEVINSQSWDMMIGFPPCTDLAVSGAAWFKKKQADGSQQRSIHFFMTLANASIERICLENPVGIMSSRWRKPDQIIQPWHYGHETTKATCLWLKNLPLLIPTSVVSKGERKFYASGKSSPMWHANSGGGCGKQRSITFQGVADAMASQWGNY